MPWLPYTGEGGSINWGQPPHFIAAPIADLARAIWARQQQQYENQQQAGKSIADAIKQQRQDQVADAIAKQYGLPGAGGQAGLVEAIRAQEAQRYKTYPVQGNDGQTYYLNADELVRLKNSNTIGRALSGQTGDLPQAYSYDQNGNIVDDQGYRYRPGPGGRLVPLPMNMQPTNLRPKQVPSLSQYIGGEVYDPALGKGRKLAASDMDVEGAWQNPDGSWSVPFNNPSFDVNASQTLNPQEQAEQHYPTQQHVQRANPAYLETDTTPYSSPPTDVPPGGAPQTITHTARIPGNVWDKFIQSTGAQPTNLLPPVSTAAPTTAPAQGQQLDSATAQMFLQQAGGDKDKARQMARDAGYVF
jgi:hypothetical protein